MFSVQCACVFECMRLCVSECVFADCTSGPRAGTLWIQVRRLGQHLDVQGLLILTPACLYALAAVY